MRKPPSPRRRWRVGELAEAAGVTVRALHHYEEAGLLSAAGRTSGDHRLYDEAGVERLYRIRVLRELGMSIGEIREAIDGRRGLAGLLRTHLARVESEVERLTLLRDRLRSISGRGAKASTDDLLATLDAMTRIQRHVQARRSARTTDANEGEARWRAVGAALRACMERGDAPASRRAMAAAMPARDMIKAFAGGDAAVLTALAQLRALQPPRDFAGWDRALMRYLDRALAAMDSAMDRE